MYVYKIVHTLLPTSNLCKDSSIENIQNCNMKYNFYSGKKERWHNLGRNRNQSIQIQQNEQESYCYLLREFNGVNDLLIKKKSDRFGI